MRDGIAAEYSQIILDKLADLTLRLSRLEEKQNYIAAKMDVIAARMESRAKTPDEPLLGCELTALWDQLADVPMDPATERIEAPFFIWPAGTSRLDIWKWFDARYPGGVYALLYPRI